MRRTSHAILRHLTRVRKVDLSEIKDAMARTGIEDVSDGSILSFIKAYTNIEIDDSARAISDGVVKRAVTAGAKAVVVGGFRYVLGGSAVISVIPMDRVHGVPAGSRGERKPKGWRVRALREIGA